MPFCLLPRFLSSVSFDDRRSPSRGGKTKAETHAHAYTDPAYKKVFSPTTSIGSLSLSLSRVPSSITTLRGRGNFVSSTHVILHLTERERGGGEENLPREWGPCSSSVRVLLGYDNDLQCFVPGFFLFWAAISPCAVFLFHRQ